MKRIIALALLLGFRASLAYGSAASAVDAEALVPARNFMTFGRSAVFQPSLKDVKAHEAATDLTLEPRLLFPYSTEFQRPYFYRVDYQRGGGSNAIFLLGSAHILSARSLPFGVLRCLNNSEVLLSELGEVLVTPDERRDLYTSFPIEQALQCDGAYFGMPQEGDTEGWFKLVPSHLRETLRTYVKAMWDLRGYSEEDMSKMHLFNPKPLADFAKMHIEEEDKCSSIELDDYEGCMDLEVSHAFAKHKKPILALEDEVAREQATLKALKAGQKAKFCGTLKSDIETIESDVQIIMADVFPEYHLVRSAHIKEMQTKNADYAAAVMDYKNGNVMPDEDDKADYDTNFRNQYWLENTLSQVLQSKGPALVFVGCNHLDWGWFEHIGKTGLLNFFQKLQDTDTAWHGAKVTRIHRLASMHPNSKSTRKRSQYHWVPEVVSTEGPYLEGLMAKLRAEAVSAGAGAGRASAGAGAIGE